MNMLVTNKDLMSNNFEIIISPKMICEINFSNNTKEAQFSYSTGPEQIFIINVYSTIEIFREDALD